MLILNLIFSVLGTIFYTSNHGTCLTMNVLHLILSSLTFIPPLFQITFYNHHREKTMLKNIISSKYRWPFYTICIITLNAICILVIFMDTFNSSNIIAIFYLKCVLSASISYITVYTSIIKPDKLQLLWIYFGMMIVFDTILYGVIAKQYIEHDILLTMIWIYDLFSFKNYINRSVVFFLFKFLFSVLLVTQLFLLFFVHDMSKIENILSFLYLVGLLTWETMQLCRLYNNFINGKNIVKQGDTIIFEHKLMATMRQFESSDKNQCPICYDQQQTQYIQLPCNHVFHENCIENWLRVNKTCPVCRLRIQFINVSIPL